MTPPSPSLHPALSQVFSARPVVEAHVATARGGGDIDGPVLVVRYADGCGAAVLEDGYHMLAPRCPWESAEVQGFLDQTFWTARRVF